MNSLSFIKNPKKKKNLPLSLESQKVTIDLLSCRAAKVGDNLQPSFAHRLTHKLPSNIKLMARNEVVAVKERIRGSSPKS